MRTPVSHTPGILRLLLLALAMTGCASRAASLSGEGTLHIRVAEEGWEEALAAEVHAVVNSAAEVLLEPIPRHRPLAIHVTNADTGPKVLKKRNARGEYRVQLNVHGRYWAQAAYQFSHELCHVLTNFDARERAGETRWFDEALCEAVSLYTLTRMAERWAYAPPFQSWFTYHGALNDYVRQVMAQHEAVHPGEQAFVPWLAAHEPRLRKNPYDRALTGIVSLRLYGVIMHHPQGLAAIIHLNQGTPASSLPVMLLQWHARVPPDQRPFVRAIARALGVAIATGGNEIAA
ncbi:MAG: hypothetical protein AB7U81_00040 [Thiohalomonadaceae bacterium]